MLFSVVLVAVCAVAEQQPCVMVKPGRGSMRIDTGGECHGTRSCFIYVDSVNLPVSEVKDQYKAGNLKSLEKKGVKVVVIPTTETISVQGTGIVSQSLNLKSACQQ
jgi:hypothetical protein